MNEPYGKLKEFDLLLFRPTDWIGKAIVWQQWGMNCLSPEFCHVGMAIERDGKLMAYWQNPSANNAAAYYELTDSKIGWKDGIAVMAYQGPALTFPAKAAAREWCEAHARTGADPYGYLSIAGFAFLGMVGRLWRGVVVKQRSNKNPISSKTMQVCSQIVDDLFDDVLKLDLLPTIGVGQALPGDLTASKFHEHVFGRLGD